GGDGTGPRRDLAPCPPEGSADHHVPVGHGRGDDVVDRRERPLAGGRRGGGVGHCPVNFGSRRSRNDAIPSAMSLVVKQMCWARASSSIASSKPASESSRRLVRLSAAVGPEARRSPHSVAVASSSSAGTTSLIRPQARA